MDSTPKNRLHSLWLRMSPLDIAALIVFFASAGLWALWQLISQSPQNVFLIVLVLVSSIYITIRVLHWVRERLLWSLRNRLVITYLFIAVVPVLLLLAMAGLAAYLLYWQLGSYVLYTQMQDRVNRLRGVTATLVTSYAVEAVSGSSVAALAIPIDVNTYLKNAMTDLPGLKIETGKGEDLLQESKGPLKDRYSGLVVNDGVLNLRSVIVRQTPSGPVVVSGIVPVTPELLETLGPELGPVRLEVLRPESVRSTHEVSVVSNRRGYSDVQEIATSQRSVPQADNPFDKLITGIVALEVLDQDRKAPDAISDPADCFVHYPAILAKPKTIQSSGGPWRRCRYRIARGWGCFSGYRIRVTADRHRSDAHDHYRRGRSVSGHAARAGGRSDVSRSRTQPGSTGSARRIVQLDDAFGLDVDRRAAQTPAPGK